MIRIFLIALLAVFMAAPNVLFAQANPQAAQFFSSMQDVPLVSGLEEVKDQTVTFDKPEGRIVESVAEIVAGDFSSVKKSYEETLPQLGWKKIEENSFAREKEFLHLNFEAYEGRNFVRVMVRPREGILN